MSDGNRPKRHEGYTHWRSLGKAEWAVARPAQPNMGKDEMKFGP